VQELGRICGKVWAGKGIFSRTARIAGLNYLRSACNTRRPPLSAICHRPDIEKLVEVPACPLQVLLPGTIPRQGSNQGKAFLIIAPNVDLHRLLGQLCKDGGFKVLAPHAALAKRCGNAVASSSASLDFWRRRVRTQKRIHPFVSPIFMELVFE
jgi:hypothetical protein